MCCFSCIGGIAVSARCAKISCFRQSLALAFLSIRAPISQRLLEGVQLRSAAKMALAELAKDKAFLAHFGISPSDRDSSLDYDFTDAANCSETPFRRGGRTYKRPWGWYKIGLRVRYPDSRWLGGYRTGLRNGSVDGEWPVSYHGTSWAAAEGIIKQVCSFYD